MSQRFVASVNFAFLCSNLSVNGTLMNAENIGVSHFRAPRVPVRPPGLAAVISLKYPSGEAGTHNVEIRFADIDGREIHEPMGQNVAFMEAPPGEFYGFHRMDVNLGDLVFPSFGEYSIVWFLDDVEMHRMGFTIADQATTSP